MLDFLSLWGSMNLIIFTIALYSVECKRRDSRYLFSFITFSMALTLLDTYSMHSNLFFKYPWFINFSTITTSLLGVHIRYYILSALGEKVTFSKQKLWHLAPAVIYLILFIAFQLQDNATKIAFFEDTEGPISYVKRGSDMFIALITLCYFCLIYSDTKKHEKIWENNFSSHDKINIKSLKVSTIIIIFTLLLSISWSTIGHYRFNMEALAIILLNTIYLTLLFRTVGKPDFIHDFELIDTSNLENDEKSDIKQSHNEEKRLYNEAVTFIESTKIYATPKLSLEELAEKMNTKKYLLSQAINNCSGQNFYTFINHYRVEEAKRQLLDVNNLKTSMEAISTECGFNSSSSFYMVFKRFEGITPFQYRKSKHATMLQRD